MTNTTVNISVLGKDYQIGTSEEQRDTLLKVSEFLNKRMAEVKKDHGLSSPENIAIMAALNLAHEVITQSQTLESQNKRLLAIKKKLGALRPNN